VTNDGVAVVEYHIDTSICTFLKGNYVTYHSNANVSVRRPISTKVVMFMGQHKAIFKEFLHHSKM
jgi:hypothetical protein